MAAKHHSPSASHASSPFRFLAARLLLSAALAIAAYLAWISFSGAGALGCGPESGCADVLNSRWAYWFGIPVSLFGLGAYALLLVVSFRIAESQPTAARRQGWIMNWLGSVPVLGGALWFTLLQIAVINSFCPWCLAAHGSASVAALLLLTAPQGAAQPANAGRGKGKGKGRKGASPDGVLKEGQALRLALAGVAGVGIVVAGQVLHKPKTFAVSQAEGPTTVATNAQADRVLSLFGGRINLNLKEVPLIGRPDAPHVMVELHDYTCKGCRQMHHPILELHRMFSNDLAIVSLPMPLDADCNPLVQQTPAAHLNACKYAQLGLAIWKASPDALPKYDEWLFGPPEPPTVEEANRFARTLVDEPRLLAAAQAPELNLLLRTSLQIYAVNLQTSGRSSMPQFVLGTNVVFGSMSAEELTRHVTNAFGLNLAP